MKSILKIEIPQSVPVDHWINEPRFAWFKKGRDYATTQTQAIPALSKCTPGELYHAVCAVMRGAGISVPTSAAAPE